MNLETSTEEPKISFVSLPKSFPLSATPCILAEIGMPGGSGIFVSETTSLTRCRLPESTAALRSRPAATPGPFLDLAIISLNSEANNGSVLLKVSA